VTKKPKNRPATFRGEFLSQAIAGSVWESEEIRGPLDIRSAAILAVEAN
jgi:hypothetical protein